MLSLDLIKEECKGYDHQTIYVSQQINISYISQKNILVCQIKADINTARFKEAILQMTSIVKKLKIEHMVIDKRHMVTIHLPSMRWFYLTWMEQMFALGLRTYYKILPENELFRFTLNMGREKIMNENPHLSYKKVNIHYYKNLKEVLHNI